MVKVNKWIGVGVKWVINGRQQLEPFSQWHFLHAVLSVSLFSKGCPGSSSLMRKHVAPVAAKQGGCMKGSSSIKDKSSFLRGSLGLPDFHWQSTQRYIRVTHRLYFCAQRKKQSPPKNSNIWHFVQLIKN